MVNVINIFVEKIKIESKINVKNRNKIVLMPGPAQNCEAIVPFLR